MAIVEFVLFALSSGLLFNDRFRKNRSAILVAATIAIISSLFLYAQVRDAAPKFIAQEFGQPVASNDLDTSAIDAEEDHIIAVVSVLYKPYLNGDPMAHPHEWMSRVPWTSEMKVLVDKMMECERRGGGEVIDSNPIISAQDYSLTHFGIGMNARPWKNRAAVQVRFLNGTEPTEVDFDMKNERGEWRVDNITSWHGNAILDPRAGNLQRQIRSGLNDADCARLGISG
jgi:hypothetical protein